MATLWGGDADVLGLGAALQRHCRATGMSLDDAVRVDPERQAHHAGPSSDRRTRSAATHLTLAPEMTWGLGEGVAGYYAWAGCRGRRAGAQAGTPLRGTRCDGRRARSILARA